MFAHDIFGLLLYLPFIICDLVPSFRKYKLQPNVVNTYEQYKTAVWRLVYTNIVHFPIKICFYFIAPYINFSVGPELESVSTIAKVVLLSYIVEDTWHYWIHRALHTPYLYKNIHKIHHTYQAPFSMVGEYAHVLETAALGVGTLLGPFILAKHVVTVYIWIAFRTFQVIEAHSGYSFPWSPCNWVPFWAGANFHDTHHKTFMNNYGSTFMFWDKVMGTAKYRDEK